MLAPAPELSTLKELALRLDTPVKTPEHALEALTALANFKKRVAEVEAQIKAGVIAHIKANGPIVNGDVRYYVAPNKTTKCLDARGVLDALMTATAGDLEAVTACLSTDAWKPAATKKVLGKDADKWFLDEVKDALKEELHTVDTRFLTQGKA